MQVDNSGLMQMRCKSCLGLTSERLEMPMPVQEWMAAVKKLKCSHCGNGFNSLLLGQLRTLAEDRSFNWGEGLTADQRILRWYKNGEIGMSAKTLADFYFSKSWDRAGDIPSDASDFRRCVLLLYRVPEIIPVIKELTFNSPWEQMGRNWSAVQNTFLNEVGPELSLRPTPLTDAHLATINAGKDL